MLRKVLESRVFSGFEVCEEEADWLESQGFHGVFGGFPPIFAEKGAVVGHA